MCLILYMVVIFVHVLVHCRGWREGSGDYVGGCDSGDHGTKKGTVIVSFENSFDSKQPKLEPKLVSALSETKRLFRLFHFYTETASFGVSIEPKQTEDQPKQTEMKAI